jgi:hypothetical protein
MCGEGPQKGPALVGMLQHTKDMDGCGRCVGSSVASTGAVSPTLLPLFLLVAARGLKEVREFILRGCECCQRFEWTAAMCLTGCISAPADVHSHGYSFLCVSKLAEVKISRHAL